MVVLKNLDFDTNILVYYIFFHLLLFLILLLYNYLVLILLNMYNYLFKLVLLRDHSANKGALPLRYVDDTWNDNIDPPNVGEENVSIIII